MGPWHWVSLVVSWMGLHGIRPGKRFSESFRDPIHVNIIRILPWEFLLPLQNGHLGSLKQFLFSANFIFWLYLAPQILQA